MHGSASPFRTAPASPGAQATLPPPRPLWAHLARPAPVRDGVCRPHRRAGALAVARVQQPDVLAAKHGAAAIRARRHVGGQPGGGAQHRLHILCAQRHGHGHGQRAGPWEKGVRRWMEARRCLPVYRGGALGRNDRHLGLRHGLRWRRQAGPATALSLSVISPAQQRCCPWHIGCAGTPHVAHAPAQGHPPPSRRLLPFTHAPNRSSLPSVMPSAWLCT